MLTQFSGGKPTTSAPVARQTTPATTPAPSRSKRILSSKASALYNNSFNRSLHNWKNSLLKWIKNCSMKNSNEKLFAIDQALSSILKSHAISTTIESYNSAKKKFALFSSDTQFVEHSAHSLAEFSGSYSNSCSIFKAAEHLRSTFRLCSKPSQVSLRNTSTLMLIVTKLLRKSMPSLPMPSVDTCNWWASRNLCQTWFYRSPTRCLLNKTPWTCISDLTDVRVNKKVGLLAALYGHECKNAFASLSKSVQILLATHQDLVWYNSKTQSKPDVIDAKIRLGNKCFGCANAFVSLCLSLVQSLANSSSLWSLLIRNGFIKELINNNMLQGTADTRSEARKVLCLLIKDDLKASSLLNSLLAKKLHYWPSLIAWCSGVCQKRNPTALGSGENPRLVLGNSAESGARVVLPRHEFE